MSEHEPPTSTNPSEIEALIARLKHGSLNNHDTLLVERLLRLLLTLIRVVEHKNTSISRLKRLLFGPGADKRTGRPGKSGCWQTIDVPKNKCYLWHSD